MYMFTSPAKEEYFYIISVSIVKFDKKFLYIKAHLCTRQKVIIEVYAKYGFHEKNHCRLIWAYKHLFISLKN